jgi:2-polyprenyl-6-hydroxyphenyl methylase / 3-demethylubiquinone-9 3-methyltransferase
MVSGNPDPLQSAPAEVVAPSIDPVEVARYQRLAASWWDPDGPFWPLHVLNRLRTGWIFEHMARELGRSPDDPMLLRGLRVLDIGCGGGILAEAVARRGAQVLGIDVTPRNLLIAREHAAAAGLSIEYREVALEHLEEPPFDLVLNMEVIEHVIDPESFLQQCLARVRPGGHLVLATLNRTLVSFLIAIVGAEYLLRILPRGTHQWRRFVRPAELTGPLGAAGFALVARSGVAVNPFTRRMRTQRYEGVNYMLLARAPRAEPPERGS